MTEQPREIVDTGLGGGSLFSFLYKPPDELSARFMPRRYSRCEILLKTGIVDGVITKVDEFTGSDQDDGVIWSLLISTDTDMSKVDQNEIAVRLLG